MKLKPISELIRQLKCGEVTSRHLVEECLRRISDPNGEGSRTFTRVYAGSARERADALDAGIRQGQRFGPLCGIPISIKDLFDVENETTAAGSLVLADRPPAQVDATIVQRLKTAGAILIGRTQMTEFAYSGLGLNPHYGTPRNPFDRAVGRIPGGSSSGAAISVTEGMAVAGIGSDTGGSVRIPAALCGLVGFKPTAQRVPMDGVLPLSPSLDSIGPITGSVACSALIDSVLSGETLRVIDPPKLSSLRLGLLQGYVLDGLEPDVSDAFDRALASLRAAGSMLVPIYFSALDRIPRSNQFSAVEAYAWHRALLETRGEQYDLRVSARIRAGANVLAADYLDAIRVRRDVILEARAAFQGLDAILLPTTPRIAPPITSLETSDSAYFDANAAMLRNPSVVNYLDGCALSVPCHREGEAPVGLMVAGLAGWDRRLLGIAAAIEAVVSPIASDPD